MAWSLAVLASCLDMWLGGHKMQMDLMAKLLEFLSCTMLTLQTMQGILRATEIMGWNYTFC